MDDSIIKTLILKLYNNLIFKEQYIHFFHLNAECLSLNFLVGKKKKLNMQDYINFKHKKLD